MAFSLKQLWSVIFRRDSQSSDGGFQHQLNRIRPFKRQTLWFPHPLFTPEFSVLGRLHSQLQTCPRWLLPNSFTRKHTRKIPSVMHNITIKVCTPRTNERTQSYSYEVIRHDVNHTSLPGKWPQPRAKTVLLLYTQPPTWVGSVRELIRPGNTPQIKVVVGRPRPVGQVQPPLLFVNKVLLEQNHTHELTSYWCGCLHVSMK